MKILITGDFVINIDYPIDNINKEIISLFQNSDYNIVNLEAPVTNSNSKIIKTGPHLKVNKVSTLAVLKVLEIDLVTLANNHVLDYDQQGVLDTLRFCQENSIATVGAGKNKETASKVFYIESAEGKIAIINMAENEWASATEITAGANGMDLIDDAKQIQEAKSKSDFVFVIVHGGHEFYNLPSPRMQKQYRFYIDNGADMVIGHHTHCISGREIHNGKPIYYSLGNFLFTEPSTYNDWYTGLVLEIEINEGKVTTSHFSVIQNKDNFGLSLLSGKAKENIDKRFATYSSEIQDFATLKNSWEYFVKQRTKTYSSYWSPSTFVKNKYLKAVLNKTGILKPQKKASALYLNLLRCEAHRDASKVFLNEILKK
ncbi:CapA family protein [Aequorivita aquimaris]|uniref:CapA family protein n=1 Tax=Aequorivita aquimaris TaxID=1548749 RepID=UPI000786B557|nr:CapA family protein [Aequorivita aquimaris]